MLYDGKRLSLRRDGALLELCFDSRDEKVNVFNREALAELADAVALLEQESADGLLMRSAKSTFVVGADITEFLGYFRSSDAEFREMLSRVNTLFSRIEDLPYPSVALINGEAQGGGFEVCLAADFRVASPSARVGLPEVKLGIMPGWGGSIRLPRLIGLDNAIEWMCGGSAKRAPEALKQHAVDAVVADEALVDAGRRILEQAKAGLIDVADRRAQKQQPLGLPDMELALSIEAAKGVVGAKAGPHYPAPLTIIDTVATHARKARDEAIPVEMASFIRLARTEVAESLVGIFLKDQSLKRLSRQQSAAATPVAQAAVLGAGIMGGGIAYQSASNGVPIVMKDIRQEALTAGLAEAGKLLQKQVERGRLKPAQVGEVLNAIQPALSYGEFGSVDLVVEAVVENPKIKQSVLGEVEGSVGDDTIITTNTSTISVNLLAGALKRPENFCGMHFFNPVHRMPLVEVIRAKTSSERAIASTVAYALAMKKTPIVVNDCPGFLVNRILFAYFTGFNQLVADGGDIPAIDKAMERWGWPMGPAYLLDVVGMDTARHAAAVMAEGFPDRMSSADGTIIDAMYQAGRLGQKNGKGFYAYEQDRKGRPKKMADPAAEAILDSVRSGTLDLEADAIVDRLMIPMAIESARCLEDDIVGSAAEVDMGLVYGLGFPPFRGGILHWVDKTGLAEFCRRADALSHLGAAYVPTDTMRRMAENGERYYPESEAATGEKA